MKRVFFPPGVTGFEDQSQWEIFKETRDALLVQLAMPLNLTDLERHGSLLRRHFKKKRPKRPRQMKRLRQAIEAY